MHGAQIVWDKGDRWWWFSFRADDGIEIGRPIGCPESATVEDLADELRFVARDLGAGAISVRRGSTTFDQRIAIAHGIVRIVSTAEIVRILETAAHLLAGGASPRGTMHTTMGHLGYVLDEDNDGEPYLTLLRVAIAEEKAGGPVSDIPFSRTREARYAAIMAAVRRLRW
jgi:hypothetical protein